VCVFFHWALVLIEQFRFRFQCLGVCLVLLDDVFHNAHEKWEIQFLRHDNENEKRHRENA